MSKAAPLANHAKTTPQIQNHLSSLLPQIHMLTLLKPLPLTSLPNFPNPKDMILYLRTTPLWTPKTRNLRSRHPVHSRNHQGTPQNRRSQTKHQHFLPPTNRWTVRKNKPMVGTIHTNLH